MTSRACGVDGVHVQFHVIGFLFQRSHECVGLRKKLKKKTGCRKFGGSPHRRPKRITSGNILCSNAEWTPDLYFRVNHTTHTLKQFYQYKHFSASSPVVPDLRDTVGTVHKITFMY
jgi:hypothetical protein